MYIVTGAAGFIGSNIIHQLNKNGCKDIIAVDDLTDGKRFSNLSDCTIADYLDKDEFLQQLKSGKTIAAKIKTIFHNGANSCTTDWQGKLMMANNFTYSKEVLHYCLERKISLIYASSAAVYGGNTTFREDPSNEKPLNVYGYSKLAFDQYVRRILAHHQITSQVAGLRYFNVYGPREQHKGSMASVAFHLYQQAKQNKIIKLFEGCDGYGNGEQLRDFIYIDDIVDVNLWMSNNKQVSGIFNVGTGKAQTFNAFAKVIQKAYPEVMLEYIPFPEHLKGFYQSFTQADMSALRTAGYQSDFCTVEQGYSNYLKWLSGERNI